MVREFTGRINRQRAAVGFTAPATKIRLDNYGLHDDGRVVDVDYAEHWRPLEPAWGWVLERLADGPIVLDDDERDRFYRALIDWAEADPGEAREHCLSYADRQSSLMLAARAGARLRMGTEPCPCGEDARYGDCAQVCGLMVDEASRLARAAHINSALQSPLAGVAKRLRTRRPTGPAEAMVDELVAAAGIGR